MKTKLLLIFLFGIITNAHTQYIDINQITPTEVSGGINVNLLVTTYNGAGYLSNSYTITGNNINLSVCYWFNVLLPVYQMSNDIFIPITNSGNYTINVSIFHSSSNITCDYFSNGPIGTAFFLSNENFENVKNKLSFFPNPTTGIIEIKNCEMINSKIQVLDNTGRLIKAINNLPNNKIDLSELNDGIYLLKMETLNGNLIQKVILRK